MNAYQKVANRGTVDAASNQPLANDRDLLDALKMSDSDAAMFLGKSRQALNTQLGPKKGARRKAPANYFKLSDIVIMVSAARQLGREFNVPAVKDYVERTRKPAGEDGKGPYKMLLGLLEGEQEKFELHGAGALVFVLPSFAELRARHADIAEDLRDIVRRAQTMNPQPTLFLLSSTSLQAKMAGQWLGIQDSQKCFGRDVVDHYLPTILLYNSANDEPRPFVLTENGTFVAAPRFLSHMVADCVRSLLPLQVSRELHPDERLVAETGD